MKFLALIDVSPGASLAAIRAERALELRASWSLDAAGILREVYATESPARVAFVLESGDRIQADATLRGLPQVAADHLRCELIELRPFANGSALFAPPV